MFHIAIVHCSDFFKLSTVPNKDCRYRGSAVDFSHMQNLSCIGKEHGTIEFKGETVSKR